MCVTLVFVAQEQEQPHTEGLQCSAACSVTGCEWLGTHLLFHSSYAGHYLVSLWDRHFSEIVCLKTQMMLKCWKIKVTRACSSLCADTWDWSYLKTNTALPHFEIILKIVQTEISTKDTLVLESLMKQRQPLCHVHDVIHSQWNTHILWIPVCVCWSAWMPSSRCQSLKRAFSGWIQGKCRNWHSASYSWHFDWLQTGHRLRGPPTNRRRHREGDVKQEILAILCYCCRSSQSEGAAQRGLTGINTDVLIRQNPHAFFWPTKSPFTPLCLDCNNNLKKQLRINKQKTRQEKFFRNGHEHHSYKNTSSLLSTMEKSGVRALWLQQEVTSDHRWSLKHRIMSAVNWELNTVNTSVLITQDRRWQQVWTGYLTLITSLNVAHRNIPNQWKDLELNTSASSEWTL